MILGDGVEESKACLSKTAASVHYQRYQENAEKVNGENQETPRI